MEKFQKMLRCTNCGAEWDYDYAKKNRIKKTQVPRLLNEG